MTNDECDHRLDKLRKFSEDVRGLVGSGVRPMAALGAVMRRDLEEGLMKGISRVEMVYGILEADVIGDE